MFTFLHEGTTTRLTQETNIASPWISPLIQFISVQFRFSVKRRIGGRRWRGDFDLLPSSIRHKTKMCIQESMIVERDAEGWGGDRARGGSRCYTEHGIDAADAAVARLAIH